MVVAFVGDMVAHVGERDALPRRVVAAAVEGGFDVPRLRFGRKVHCIVDEVVRLEPLLVFVEGVDTDRHGEHDDDEAECKKEQLLEAHDNDVVILKGDFVC